MEEPILVTQESSDESYVELPYYEQTVLEIKQGEYPCMVCTIELSHESEMWACHECYRVYDHECIREWATKSLKNGNTWRCPNCYFTYHNAVPKVSKCWCGKVTNPPPNFMNPGSCGQTCGAKSCVHGCAQICHLGPHQECAAMVTQKCHCGKETVSIPCHVEKKDFHCNNKCNKLLACGVHRCQKGCHSGFCGPCDEGIKVRCYCGDDSKIIKCHKLRIKGKSMDSWIGGFACEKVRDVFYDCGVHSYKEKCTVLRNKKPTKCPMSPELLHTCPCGQTEVSVGSRTSCEDPIPTCELACSKKLSCGHQCQYRCHEGPCPPCYQVEKVPCQCQLHRFLVPCAFTQSGQQPKCTQKCDSMMSCRRHRCTNQCCDSRLLAVKRSKTILLQSQRFDESLVEAAHICLKTCNQKLPCGLHQCQRKCHPGPCPRCLESDSNDLVCHCGKTVVPAPVRCGTKLPPCPHPCKRTTACGHPQMPHNCHEDNVPCPPCTYEVYKPCICGKSDHVRTLCFQDDVRCGQPCGKTMYCGRHKCSRSCHTGPCPNKCNSLCLKKKPYCDHMCTRKCHMGDCDLGACLDMKKVHCACGRITKSMRCGASEESAPVNIVLECDSECHKIARQKQLMEAFGQNDESAAEQLITAENYDQLELPYSELCLQIFNKQRVFCSKIAETLDKLIADESRESLHFKPMKTPQRQFIHELAVSGYKLYAESQDKEPNRSVFVKKTNLTELPYTSMDESYNIYSAWKQKVGQKNKPVVTKTFINVPIEETEIKPANLNCMVIDDFGPGLEPVDYEDPIRDLLKFTLVNDSIFVVRGDRCYIYPARFMELSENAENDLLQALPHVKKVVTAGNFIGKNVRLVKIDDDDFEAYEAREVAEKEEKALAEARALAEAEALAQASDGSTPESVSVTYTANRDFSEKSQEPENRDSVNTPETSINEALCSGEQKIAVSQEIPVGILTEEPCDSVDNDDTKQARVSET